MRCYIPIFLAVFLAFSLGACSLVGIEDADVVPSKTRVIEGLTGVQNTIQVVGRLTNSAFQAGAISAEEQCKVEQYGRIADMIADEAVGFIVRAGANPSDDELLQAIAMLEDARLAFDGASAEAQRLAQVNC